MKKILTTLALALVTTTATFAQVGIGTKTPDASAILDLNSTEKGFLPPRVTTAERDAIASPAEGLTIYNTDNGCLEFYNSAFWVSACDGSAQPGPTSACGSGFIPPFLPSDQTIINDVTVAGETWMDRNLGAYTADRTSPGPSAGTDCWSYGNLYQWGRASDGHEYRASGTTFTLATTAVPNAGNPWDGLFIKNTNGPSPNDWLQTQDNTLWQGVNGTNNPCPAGYRLPTKAEWDAFRTTLSPINYVGTSNSPLKLPFAGTRGGPNGTIFASFGSFWSSTVPAFEQAGIFSVVSDDAFTANNRRAAGISVRCIRD